MNTYQMIYLISVLLILSGCYIFGKNNQTVLRISILLFLGFQLTYLIWRTTSTLPTASILSIIAGLALLFTEWMGYIQSLITSSLFWKKNKRKKVFLSSFKTLPTVDIMIATYNEPVDLLRRTIVASQLMDYPDDLYEILVCDDGKREDVRVLCEELGVRHVTREDNKHAKAGNLNHAMEVSTGEIIVTMDADMIPRANFMQETLGYFSDEKVGFVQAPQAFYNDDPFQFNLFAGDRINNEQDFFMQKLEEKKDIYNATMYIGSNALFRRKTMEEIGGFATGVITEDMATGMLIQAGGWETVFVNKVLAVGLAPETFKDLLKQRDRWCRGNIQVVRKWNPLKTKGLSFMQKLLYMDGIHYWFFGLYKLVYLIAPILYLVFGIIVLNATFIDLMVYWVPAFISSQVFSNLISEKKRTTMWTNVYDSALAPSMSWAILSEIFLKGNGKFNVTRKGIQTNERQFLWRASWFHIVLAVLSFIGIFRVILALVAPQLVDLQIDSVYINLFWVLYNLAGVLLVIMIFFERPRYRTAERLIISKGANITDKDQKIQANIEDLSEYGARLSVDTYAIKEKLSTVDFVVEGGPALNAEVRWVDKNKEGKTELGIQFNSLDKEQYRFVIQTIYSNPKSNIGEKSYRKAGLLPTALGFFTQSKKAPASKTRMILRERIKTNGLLTYQHLKYSASVVDLSEEGAQIKTKAKLKKEDRILLDAPENNIIGKTGEVRWVKKSLGSTYAGIQFVDK
ncbi:glycosyltransferase [Marinilactibacillus sp. Marseille-P9653]|uniref:glycosyltransferase n=1 Tax=Marinilactibacillus sp. Marseille-P9653 TaxID=2866583 RepID=UPI001CE3DF38|nr:glycosyltransferase [Marinilactibacillus sp. Marseille-P9653]